MQTKNQKRREAFAKMMEQSFGKNNEGTVRMREQNRRVDKRKRQQFKPQEIRNERVSLVD